MSSGNTFEILARDEDSEAAQLIKAAHSKGPTNIEKCVNSRFIDFVTCEALCKVSQVLNSIRYDTRLRERMVSLVADASGFEMDKDKYGFMGARWPVQQLKIGKEEFGTTLALRSKIEADRTFLISSFEESVYSGGKKVWANLKLDEANNFMDLQQETIIFLLCSTLCDLEDYSLRENVEDLRKTINLPGSSKRKFENAERSDEQLEILKKHGNIRSCNSMVRVAKMSLGELFEACITDQIMSLEQRLTDYVALRNCAQYKTVMNSSVCSMTLQGTARVNGKRGSSKNFKFVMEHNGAHITGAIRIYCDKTINLISTIKMTMEWEVNLLQQHIIDLYSQKYSSPGVLSAPLSDIISVQDAVWDVLVEKGLVEAMSQTDDMSIANIADLVPLMTLAGVVPASIEQPAVYDMWFRCIRELVEKLCDATGSFDSVHSVKHFISCVCTSLMLSRDCDSCPELAKFVIQFFLWGVPNKVGRAAFMQGILADAWSVKHRKDKMENRIAAIGAQAFWLACEYFTNQEMNKIGYKYLADIILYNLLTTGKAQIKLVSLGFWLCGCFNSGTNFIEEDAKLFNRCAVLGIDIDNETSRQIMSTASLAKKISLLLDALITLTIPKISTVRFEMGDAEACGVIVSLKQAALEESGEEMATEEAASNFAVKLVTRISKAVETGEIREQVASELINGIIEGAETLPLAALAATSEDSNMASVIELLNKEAKRIVKYRRETVGEDTRAMVESRNNLVAESVLKMFSKANATHLTAILDCLPTTTESQLTRRERLNQNLSSLVATTVLHTDNYKGTDISICSSALQRDGYSGMSFNAAIGGSELASVSVVDASLSRSLNSGEHAGGFAITVLGGLRIISTTQFTVDINLIVQRLRSIVDSVSSTKELMDVKQKSILRQTKRGVRISEISTEGALPLALSKWHDSHRREDFPDDVNRTEGINALRSIFSLYVTTLYGELADSYKLEEEESGKLSIAGKVMVLCAIMPLGAVENMLILARRLADAVWDVYKLGAKYLINLEDAVTHYCEANGLGKLVFVYVGLNKLIKAGIVAPMYVYRPTYEITYFALTTVVKLAKRKAFDCVHALETSLGNIHSSGLALLRNDGSVLIATRARESLLMQKAQRIIAARGEGDCQSAWDRIFRVLLISGYVMTSIALYPAVKIKTCIGWTLRVMRRGLSKMKEAANAIKAAFADFRSTSNENQGGVENTIKKTGETTNGDHIAIDIEAYDTAEDTTPDSENQSKDLEIEDDQEVHIVEERDDIDSQCSVANGERVITPRAEDEREPNVISITNEGQSRQSAYCVLKKVSDYAWESIKLAFTTAWAILTSPLKLVLRRGEKVVNAIKKTIMTLTAYIEVKAKKTGATISTVVADEVASYSKYRIDSFVRRKGNSSSLARLVEAKSGKLVSKRKIGACYVSGKLLDDRDYCCGMHAFIESWPYLKQNFEVEMAACNNSNCMRYELLSKSKMLVHGNIMCEESARDSQVIELFDCDKFTVLKIPSTGGIKVAAEHLGRNKTKRIAILETGWKYNGKSAIVLSSPEGASSAIVGRAAVLANKCDGSEIMVTPAHVWKFGESISCQEDADQIICLGSTNVVSTLNSDEEQQSVLNLDDDDDRQRAIVCRKILETKSNMYCFCTVDAINWQGRSGWPVVTATNNLVGICIMQLLANGSPDVFDGAGVIVCCCNVDVEWPLLVAPDLTLVACTKCNEAADLPEEARGRTNSERSLVNERSSERQHKSASGRRTISNIARSLKPLWGSEKFKNSASPTGVLNDACRIVNKANQDSIDKSIEGGDSASIHNLKEVLYLSDDISLSSVSKAILRECLKTCVLGKRMWLVLTENHMMLGISALLTGSRIRFNIIRTAVAFKIRTKTEKQESYVINLCCWEDMMCWLLTNNLERMLPSTTVDNVIMIHPDGEKSAARALDCMKLMLLVATSVRSLIYSSNTTLEKSQDSECTLDKEAFYGQEIILTQQSAGSLCVLNVTSNEIMRAEMTEKASSSSVTRTMCCVLTMPKSSTDMEKVKARAARALELDKSVVVCFPINSIIAEAAWLIIKKCSYIVLHGGLSANCAAPLIPNCMECRLASKAAVETIRDALKICALTRQSWEFVQSFTYSISHPIIGMSNEKRSSVLFKIKPKAKSSFVDVTEAEIHKKIDAMVINGVCLIKDCEPFAERYKGLRADLSLKSYDIAENNLLTDEIAMMRFIDTPITTKVWSSLSSLWKNIKWWTFSATTAIEVEVIKMMQSMRKWLLRIVTKTAKWLKSRGDKLSRIVKATAAVLIGKRSNRAKKTYRESDRSLENIASNVTTALGISTIASTVVEVHGRCFSVYERLANGVYSGVAWLAFKLVFGTIAEKPSGLLGKSIYIAARAGLCFSIVTHLSGVGWSARFGNIMATDTNEVVQIITSKLTAWYLAAGAEFAWSMDNLNTKLEGVEKTTMSARKTAEIITLKREGRLGLFSIILNIVTAANYAIDVIYRWALSFDIGSMIDAIWAGIKTRNEASRGPKGTVTAVHCVEIVEVSAGLLVLGLCGAASYKIAASRSSRSAATIGVLTDRKHAADLIELYSNDRAVFSTVSRMTTLACAIMSVASDCPYMRIFGSISAVLLVVDYLTEKRSVLGVSYRLSNLIARVSWSRCKIETAIVSLLGWLTNDDTIAGLGNIVVITAKKLRDGDDMDTRWLERSRKMCIEAQNRERIGNAILTDLTKDPAEAYREAKSYVLNGSYDRDSDFNDKERWGCKDSSLEEVINFSAIARQNYAEFGEDSGEVIETLGKCVKNQCRYLGRTSKLRWREDERSADYEENQASVFFLDEKLWRDVVDVEDRADWAAAGDSRYAVIFAIAERNDVRTKFNVSDDDITKVCQLADLLIARLTCFSNFIAIRTRGVDWCCVIKNVNEKATSGILTRSKTGLAITAGYLSKFASRVEMVKEMLIDGNCSHEVGVINLFAKRRIEKKKISQTTGIKCVITRTIQGNECDAKLAVIEAFVLMDKMIKMSRSTSGICVGMNFFCEYSDDDLNVMLHSSKISPGKRCVRVSLDHSSFDGNQRNWSLVLMREIRIKIIELLMRRGSRQTTLAGRYVRNCYDLLLIRVMLTPAGDMFALTGQQMSGHATTTSDNSMRAWLYAYFCAEKLKDIGEAALQDNSMRVQGDDTKMNLLIDENVSDEDIKNSISVIMADIGQRVSAEKIVISKQTQGCGFLSHNSRFFVFRVNNSGKISYELHYAPIRERRDIFAMIAVTLKSKKGAEATKKTKKDVSLLAAKAMSYLVMYTPDLVIVKLCCTVLVGCFTILSAMKAFSSRIDINDKWLPWLGVSGGISGEFKIDLVKALERHGICRRLNDAVATHWMFEMDEETVELLNRITSLQKNFKECFYKIKSWSWTDFEEAFKVEIIDGPRRLMGVDIGKVNGELQKIDDSLTLAVATNESKYTPFVTLKNNIVGSMKAEYAEPLTSDCIGVIVSEEYVEAEIMELLYELYSSAVRIEKREKFVSDEGLMIVDDKAFIGRDETNNIVTIITDKDETLKALNVKPWLSFEVIGAFRNNLMSNPRVVDILSSYGNTRYIAEQRTRYLKSFSDVSSALKQEIGMDRLTEIFAVRVASRIKSTLRIVIDRAR